MHDQREKAQRDYDWMLSTARRQGIEESIEQGIEQGIEKGREEDAIIGAIQALQQILGTRSPPPIRWPLSLSRDCRRSFPSYNHEFVLD
jgi:hypothetical protein